MRNSFAIVFTCFLLLLTLPFQAKLIAATQNCLIDPNDPPEEIEVLLTENFTISVPGSAWYLARFDRDKLSFKSKIIDSTHISFVMQPLKTGSAHLVISLKERDVLINLSILEGTADKPALPEAIHADDNAGPESERTGIEESIVAERVEALKKRVLVEDNTAVVPEAETDTDDISLELEISAETKAVDGDTADEENRVSRRKEAVANPDTQAMDAPKNQEPGKDDIYYVDGDNTIVMVPRKQEDDVYRRGRRYFRKGEYSRAETELMQYLSGCETCRFQDESRFMLVDIALYSGDEENALEYLHELAQSKVVQTVLTAVELRAELHHQGGRYSEALKDYEQVYNSGNRNLSTLQKMGDLYYLQEEYGSALQVYEEGVAHGIENDSVVFRIASIYDAPGPMRNLEKAYQHYKMLASQFQSSQHYDRAVERMRFFEKNFFDYQ